MKDQIISILGDNHINTIELLASKNYDDPYGLYTYRGEVYVLKNGDDLYFDELSPKEQTYVFNQVVSNKYKVNKTLQ